MLRFKLCALRLATRALNAITGTILKSRRGGISKIRDFQK